GFNYRMTNIEAALGLAQFERLSEFLNKRKEFVSIYREVLGNLSDVCFQQQYDGAVSDHWLICAQFNQRHDISKIVNQLNKQGIVTRRVFRPLTHMPYLEHYKTDCPNAEHLYKTGLCLPSSTLNITEDIYKVATTLREVICE